MPSNALPWIAILVASAGLLAVGLFALVKDRENARHRGTAAALRATRATARSLRAVLTGEEFFEGLPADWRFEVARGQVRVPAALGELEQVHPRGARSRSLELSLPTAVRILVQSARAAEFDQADPGAALILLQRAGTAYLAGEHAAWLSLQVAQVAMRCDNLPVAHEQWNRLGVFGGGDGPVHPELAVGLVLLARQLDQELPVWTEPLLCRLPVGQARALVREIGGERWLPDVEASGQRRARLRIATEWIQQADLAESCCDVLSEHAVIYRPGAGGAVVSRPELQRMLAQATGDDTLRWIEGSAAEQAVSEAKAIGVMSGLALKNAAALPEDGVPLEIAILGLAVLLGVGILSAVRGAGRERADLTARAEFLSAVTHELKTPVAGIRMLTDLIGDPRLGTERREDYGRDLAAECGRLTVLIDNVLDLGQLERGTRAYDFVEVSLAELVSETVELYRPLASRDGLEIEFKSEGDATVRADRAAFTQLLLNLLENARRYGKSPVLVTVEGTRVTVRDHGPGVAVADRERIFEKFERGSGAFERGNPGIGLGLFLARAIAGAHGAELRLAIAVSPGACFVLEFPS